MNTEQNDLVIQEFLSQFELATIEQDTPREEFLSQFELAPKESAGEPECDLNGLEKIELYGATFWVPAPVTDVYRKIIVTQYEEVAAMAPDFDIVFNDEPELGISHSMQLGIEAAGDADAFIFCVCDQPGITASAIQKLIDAYKKGTAGIVSLAWQGKMRNPKIFSARYTGELMQLSGDTGGRQIISAHKSDLLLVEADSEDEVKDIDSL